MTNLVSETNVQLILRELQVPFPFPLSHPPICRRT
jgi:hypothetical protein